MGRRTTCSHAYRQSEFLKMEESTQGLCMQQQGLVVATASLEVGFNDTEIDLFSTNLLVPSFCSVKEEQADQNMRPWTIVVLS